MTTCPSCGVPNRTLILNIATGTRFCADCAGTACPTFMRHYVLTREDVAFMRACGIDPEVQRVEDARFAQRAASMAQNPVLDHMMRNNIPLTRENYLKLAYFGNPPEELSAEEEAGLPQMFQLDAGEEFE